MPLLHSVEKTALPRYLTPAEAAAIMHVQPDTLRKWRAVGFGPRWYRVNSRNFRYLESDCVAFMETTSSSGQ